MTTQVANFFHAINTPYVKPAEDDLYDLSEGANYSLLTDFQSWGTAFAISLVVFTKVLPYIGWAEAFPLTATDTLAIGALGTTSAALTKRVVGFGKDEKSETYGQRSLANHMAYAGFIATALFVVPRVTQVAYETMAKLVVRTLFPMPIIFNFYHALSTTASLQSMAAKIEKIHKDYRAHHPKIMKLDDEKQKSILSGMQSMKLEPPKEIRDGKNAFIKEFHPTDHIFVHSDPKENEVSEWVKGKVNAFLEAVHLPTMAPLKEADKLMTDAHLKELNLQQLQWVVLSLCYSSDLELTADDFKKLTARAKEIEEADPTGLVEQLKKADTVDHLKFLVNYMK